MDTVTVIRIECACTVCRANNNGEPLSALAPEGLLRKVGDTKTGRHSLVYSANEPGVLGDAVRAATGLQRGN